jgi:hypothetical protein
VPEADQTGAVFAAAAKAFDLDATTLETLAALRSDSSKDNGKIDAAALFAKLLVLLAALADHADAMAGATT